MWQSVDLVLIVLKVLHLVAHKFGYSNYVSPRVIHLWQQSRRICVLCAFMLWDIVMTVIGCVTLTLISIAEVEITWQVVCITERPLQRYSSPKDSPIKCVDKYVFLSGVSCLFCGALKVNTILTKKKIITSKNKQSCKTSIFKGCHHQLWQAWHDSSHF